MNGENKENRADIAANLLAGYTCEKCEYIVYGDQKLICSYSSHQYYNCYNGYHEIPKEETCSHWKKALDRFSSY